MYKIRGINGTEKFDIMEIRDSDLLGMDPVLNEEINKVPSLSFSVPVTNINYDRIKKLETEIIVEDLNGGVEIFRGRCMNDGSDFYNTKKCTCEGALAYLVDTKQPPYLYTGGLYGFIEMLLNEHNSKVAEKQKVYIGNITVSDPNNYMRRESEKDYESPLNIIQNKVVESYGGLLLLRRTNGKNYLDYLKDYPVSDQVARFGENILGLNKYSKAESVRTVIIPLGAEDEETGKRVDITSVNNGKNYIVDEALVTQYGWIEEVVYWDDVTEPQNLLKKAQEYLNDCKNMSLTIDLTAVDCRLLGMDVRRITPGMMVKVVSRPHHLDTYFLCTSKTTNLLNPDKDRIVLGSEIKTYTGTINRDKYQLGEKIQKTETTMTERINKTKEEFKEELDKASGLYKTEVKQSDGSYITYYHDKKNLNDSQIQMVFNSAGFALTANGGADWYGMKVDGDMIAKILSVYGINADWIKAGTLSADFIEGGKIRSLNFAEKKVGTEIDLETSDITMYAQDASGNLITIKLSKGSFSREITDTGGNVLKRVNINSSGVRVTDGKTGRTASVSNGVIGFVDDVGNYFLQIGATQSGETGIDIGGRSGATGRAEFSDGSYLDFKYGMLVGGKTSNGGVF